MNLYEKIDHTQETYRANIPKPKPTWPPRVQRAIIFIVAHLYDERLAVGWMMQQCRINGHDFSSRFAYYLNKTSKQYITHHRLKASKALLLQTEADISIIAFSVGYHALSTFDNAFKRKEGQRPSVWREHRRRVRGK